MLVSRKRNSSTVGIGLVDQLGPFQLYDSIKWLQLAQLSERCLPYTGSSAYPIGTAAPTLENWIGFSPYSLHSSRDGTCWALLQSKVSRVSQFWTPGAQFWERCHKREQCSPSVDKPASSRGREEAKWGMEGEE